jgi:MmpS family membrane protein
MAPPPPKKRRKWPFVVGGIFLLLVIIGVANGGNTQPAAPVAAPPAPSEALATLEDIASGGGTVTLSVEGSGQATVSYLHDGGLSQETVSLPWSKDVEAGFIGSLTAQRKSGNSGSISCKITGGTEVRAESESDGPYAVVSCTG